MLGHSSKKMSESFSVISNLAVNTHIAVDYSGENFFLKGIFESKEVTQSTSGSHHNIKLFVINTPFFYPLKTSENLS